MNIEVLGLIFSTLGTADQPGWWPHEYILGFEVILVALIILVGWKSLIWIIRPS